MQSGLDIIMGVSNGFENIVLSAISFASEQEQTGYSATEIVEGLLILICK